MKSSEFVLRSSRVVTPAGVVPADIRVSKGRIDEVASPGEARETNLVDAGDLVVLPGLVDSHVHVNDPGTDWEGFASATAAAAAGGITTIVDMPLNSLPVTCTPDALAVKLQAASGSARVDCAFWGGVIPGNVSHLRALAGAGVAGFKCFLVDSGLAEFPPVSEADLREAMGVIAGFDGILLVHAELTGPMDTVAEEVPAASSSHADWLASRPAAAEVEAVRLVIDTSRATGCRVHIVHVSAAETLALLRDARADGVRITAETCPHYLAFTSGGIPDGGTAYKCAPPIRDAANRERLWEGLSAGDLDLVASDHSPCPAAMKEGGDFFECWGGIASLQLGLPAIWTEASRRGHDVAVLARWMSEGPARLAGLDLRKGRIAPGLDADLVLFDPDREFVVDGESLFHRHALTPYEGRTLRGAVARTYLRGQVVYTDGALVGSPTGVPLLKPGSPVV